MSGASSIAFLEEEAACSPQECGPKAARLAQMRRAGLPVPNGFTIETAAFDRIFPSGSESIGGKKPEAIQIPEDIARDIADALTKLGNGTVAVRSSGIGEDLDDASFAGQYESVLGVQGLDALLRAVRTCWASAFSPRVMAYRKAHQPATPVRVAVLVQRQLDPEAAGVAFTANPINGQRNEVIINAVAGLGDKLVSGTADAETWVVRQKASRESRIPNVVLHSAQAMQIAELARRVESLLGAPQDIEWAIESGMAYLLQTRPITALPEPADWHPPTPGLWLRAFRIGEWLGDPLTPLFESWLLPALEDCVFRRFAQIMRSAAEKPYHVAVNGWYFTTANFLPRSIPDGLWLAVRQLLPAFLRHPRALSLITTSFAHVGMTYYDAEWRAGPKQRYEDAVKSAEARMSALDPAGLVRLLDELCALAGDEMFYFFAVGGGAWKAEYSLARFYARHLKDKGAGGFQELLVGLADVVADRSHAVLSLDWSQPTLGELDYAGEDHPPSRQTDMAKMRKAACDRMRRIIGDGTRRRKRFEFLLARAQHFGRVREEQAMHLTLAWPVMRRAIGRLAAPLVARGTLRAASEVYFITRDEVIKADAADADLQRRLRERKEQWQRQRRLVPPAYVGEMSWLRARILSAPERIFRMEEPDQGGSGVRGVPASPGRASGPVRIIRGTDDFSRLRKGDVLVAVATSPAWTPLFTSAVAIVTDTGSAMAHASLVAREYGIPAVVGTTNATARLRDGQWVTVDGARGVILLVQHGEGKAPESKTSRDALK